MLPAERRKSQKVRFLFFTIYRASLHIMLKCCCFLNWRKTHLSVRKYTENFNKMNMEGGRMCWKSCCKSFLSVCQPASHTRFYPKFNCQLASQSTPGVPACQLASVSANFWCCRYRGIHSNHAITASVCPC